MRLECCLFLCMCAQFEKDVYATAFTSDIYFDCSLFLVLNDIHAKRNWLLFLHKFEENSNFINFFLCFSSKMLRSYTLKGPFILFHRNFCMSVDFLIIVNIFLKADNILKK